MTAWGPPPRGPDKVMGTNWRLGFAGRGQGRTGRLAAERVSKGRRPAPRKAERALKSTLAKVSSLMFQMHQKTNLRII